MRGAVGGLVDGQRDRLPGEAGIAVVSGAVPLPDGGLRHSYLVVASVVGVSV